MKVIKQVRIFEKDRQIFDTYCRTSGQKLSSVIEYLAREALKGNVIHLDKSRQRNKEDFEREKVLTSVSIDEYLYNEICERDIKFHSFARQLLNNYAERIRQTEELSSKILNQFNGQAILK
jgi:hypothetical protein